MTRRIANTIEPLYKVGEVVAVAQRYSDIYPANTLEAQYLQDKAGWRNKMFVAADMMIHHIRIINVRQERLQDISDEDCIKEGVVKGRVGSEDTHLLAAYYAPNIPSEPHIFPQGAFFALIDRISGRGTWVGNPEVWVYEFELVD